MGVLKTIVATAVIVFALTTVAMAGVQHFAKSGPAATQAAQHPDYTITLTDKQLATLLLAGQKQAATHTPKHAEQRHTQKHADTVEHAHAATHAATHSTSHQASAGTSSSGGYRCYDDGHSGDSGHVGGSCDSHADHGGCD